MKLFNYLPKQLVPKGREWKRTERGLAVNVNTKMLRKTRPIIKYSTVIRPIYNNSEGPAAKELEKPALQHGEV
jgi:hypothetical protein